MFAGSTLQIPLAEVCRLLSASNQTGALNLNSPDNSAGPFVINFYLGQIIEAQCASITGLDALSEICNFSGLVFMFEVGAVSQGQSLAVYPTLKLIERIRQQVKDHESLRAAMPDMDDLLIYQPDADMSGLDATADELGLLLLCDGSRNLRDIAGQVNKNPLDIARVIAKFRQAGIISVKKQGQTSIADSNEGYLPDAGGAASVPQSGAPRYWRGKLVE